MDVILKKSELISGSTVTIPGSKSETNRLVLLQAQFPNLTIGNFSDSDDSRAMIAAINSGESTIDIGHAGTAMRFLTAWFAIQHGRTVILTGSERMCDRPVGILVDALKQLGANIEYIQKPGFPPLKIIGQQLVNDSVTMDADVSSQYISALLLIAPSLSNGLKVSLRGNITSAPYIEMTRALLNKLEVTTSFEGNIITIFPVRDFGFKGTINVESDWSAASYYYSMIALSKDGTSITLREFSFQSRQGDQVLAEIYKKFGVITKYDSGSITLAKTGSAQKNIVLNLESSPDLAQTIAVTALGLGCECSLSGLHTLKIKETDRLQALQNEMRKLGGTVEISGESLYLESGAELKNDVSVDTYDDHRMAMAFAPLALIVPLTIKNGAVVSKSYPMFWQHLKQIGLNFTESGS